LPPTNVYRAFRVVRLQVAYFKVVYFKVVYFKVVYLKVVYLKVVYLKVVQLKVVRRKGGANRSVQSWPGTARRPIEKLNCVHHGN
jgi:hypothetical protein